MKKTVIYLALIIFLFSMVLPGCRQAAAPTGESVKIGALLSLTGAFLNLGPKLNKGIELSLEHYNWEAAGKKIELIVEDDGTDPTIALDKARKLVEKDGVTVIIGLLHSGVAQAVQPYLTEKKVICVKGGMFPAPLTAKFPYLFVPSGTQRQVTTPMGDYAYNVLKYRKVTVLGPDYVAGRDFVGGFIDKFKELGGIIVQEQWAPVDAMDYSPYLVNLKEADALVAWNPGVGAVRLLKQYGEYGIRLKLPLIAPFVGGFLDEDILPQIGDIALGIPAAGSYASTVDNPLNKKVVADFKRKYNERPGDSAIVGGYISAQIMVEALKATKGDTNPDKIKEAIVKLNIDTPAGPIRFTPERLGIFSVHIVKIDKVTGEYVWQVVQTYKDVMPR